MNVQHLRRRFFLGTASGLGAVVAAWLALKGQASRKLPDEQQPRRVAKPTERSCIFVFLVGGPSQFDLYENKPALSHRHGEELPVSLIHNERFSFIGKEPKKILGTKREFRRYGQSGLEVSELLPHLSGRANQLAYIRSLYTDEFEHHAAQLLMQTGASRGRSPSIGSWVLYGLGQETRDIPDYVVLWSGESLSFSSDLWDQGFLPSRCKGVLLGSGTKLSPFIDSPIGFSGEVQDATVRSVAALNDIRYRDTGDGRIAERTAAYEAAARLQLAAPELVNTFREPKHIIDGYGLNDPVTRGFGRSCLLARRLVERGCRFVTLFHSNWDHHRNVHTEVERRAKEIDRPLATLLADLEATGLAASTVVVCTGEFGRTPVGQNVLDPAHLQGRDHHRHAFPAWLAGAGVAAGNVVGITDEFGWRPVEGGHHIRDFHATLLALLGLDHRALEAESSGRPFQLASDEAQVIPELMA